MKNKVLLSLIILLTALAVSCDKLDRPYATEKEITVDTTKRKVLLEDYTGMKCVNCPAATKLAEALVDLYQGQVILMAVHAGFFADPDATGHYTADYRVPEGVAWFNDFVLISNPMGMVNRITWNGKKAIVSGSWADAVASVAQEKKVANLDLVLQYTPQNRGEISITVHTKFLEPLEGVYNLSVCILEDSIVGWQKNNDTLVGPVPEIENYVFNDMLRAVLNGTYGDELTAAPDTGIIYTKTYPYTLNTAWVPTHLSFIAFVFHQETREIVQVEKKHLIK